MNFVSGLSKAKNLFSIFGKKTPLVNGGASADVVGNLHLWRAAIRYVVRLLLLGMILFIFIWWPVENFSPEGFDAWSKRMTDLPMQVWGLISGIVMFWATGEIMAQRVDNQIAATTTTVSQTKITQTVEEDEEDFDSMEEELDGRFANLADENDFLSGPVAPNPVIEEWRKNEAG